MPCGGGCPKNAATLIKVMDQERTFSCFMGQSKLLIFSQGCPLYSVLHIKNFMSSAQTDSESFMRGIIHLAQQIPSYFSNEMNDVFMATRV